MKQQEIVNCWNSIGVWGRERPRCALLQEVIHCRNCEKFINTGRDVQSKLPVQDYLRDWAARLAEARERYNQAEKSLLVFRVGELWLGLTCSVLDEVCTQRKIRRIPNIDAPAVQGVVNISGKVQLCFSLSRLFNIEGTGMVRDRRKSLYNPLVVTLWHGQKYVFPVSEVLGIFSYDIKDIQVVARSKGNNISPYISGKLTIEQNEVWFLDAGAVFRQFDRDLTAHAG